jgi:hypothetical protein
VFYLSESNAKVCVFLIHTSIAQNTCFIARIKSLEISQQSCKSYPGVDQSEILNSNVLNNEEGRFEKMSGHFKNGMNNTKIYSNSNTSPTSECVNTIYKKPTTNPFSSSDQLYSVSAQEETGRQRLEELRR